MEGEGIILMKPAEILIVEDERVVAMALEDALTAMGHHICGIANSGSQALSLAASGPPDLVLMDIKIKGPMDGVDTAKRLKEIHHIPVVFLTAYSDQDIIARAKAAEPLGYILKPFKTSEVTAVMELALYKAGMEKKLRLLNQDLEQKVEQRTQSLMDEIQLRKKAEEGLQLQTEFLQKANKALMAALEHREAEKRAIEQEFHLKIEKHVLSYMDFIRLQHPGPETATAIEDIKNKIHEVLQPSFEKQFVRYQHLSPQEIKIADLIRHGKSSKEIAELMNIAPSSVSTYRNHIRKKMGLLNANTNLEVFLNALE